MKKKRSFLAIFFMVIIILAGLYTWIQIHRFHNSGIKEIAEIGYKPETGEYTGNEGLQVQKMEVDISEVENCIISDVYYIQSDTKTEIRFHYLNTNLLHRTEDLVRATKFDIKGKDGKTIEKNVVLTCPFEEKFEPFCALNMTLSLEDFGVTESNVQPGDTIYLTIGATEKTDGFYQGLQKSDCFSYCVIEFKIPPEEGNSDSIKCVEVDNPDLAATVNKYQPNGNFTIQDNILTVSPQDNPETLLYYSIHDNKMEEINTGEAVRIQDSILFNQIDVAIDFSYFIYNGTVITQNHTKAVLEDGLEPAFEAYDICKNNKLWFVVSTGSQQSYKGYYLYYDMEQKKLIDIFHEIDPSIQNIEYLEISPDGNEVIYKANDYYVLDLETKKIKALSKEVSSELISSASFVNNDLIFFSEITGDQRDSVYTYDLKTGNKKNIIQDKKIIYSDTEAGYIPLGNGFHIYKTSEHYYLLNPYGERYEIAGLDPEDNWDFLLSPDQKRIAISLMSGENGLVITKLGVIDIDKRELKFLEVNAIENKNLASYGWNSRNQLALTVDKNILYLYTLR